MDNITGNCLKTTSTRIIPKLLAAQNSYFSQTYKLPPEPKPKSTREADYSQDLISAADIVQVLQYPNILFISTINKMEVMFKLLLNLLFFIANPSPEKTRHCKRF